MNNRFNPVSSKLRKGSEQLLFGKSVWVFRDKEDGTVCICDDKSLHDEFNFWTVLKSDLSPAPKPVKPIPKRHKKLDPEEQQFQIDLDNFFKSLWEDKHHFKCQNCRADLFATNNSKKRACSAHILAKSKYPSIAMNEDNILYMGVLAFGASCGCHTAWDSNVARRMKMAVYNLALKRFELLKPYLDDKELIMAEEDLGIREKSLNLAKDLESKKSA